MYQSNIAAGKKRNHRTKHRDFIIPDDDQQFAVITELLGNGRANASCQDGRSRLARIRGSLRRGPNKAIINKGDLVIISNRDFEDKVDLIHKYTHEEASSIFRQYHLSDSLKKAFNNEVAPARENETEYIDFANSDDEHDAPIVKRDLTDEYINDI